MNEKIKKRLVMLIVIMMIFAVALGIVLFRMNQVVKAMPQVINY